MSMELVNRVTDEGINTPGSISLSLHGRVASNRLAKMGHTSTRFREGEYRRAEAYTTSDFAHMADLLDRSMSDRYMSVAVPTTFQALGYRRDTNDLARTGTEGTGREYEIDTVRLVDRVAEKGEYLPSSTEESYYLFRTYKYGEQWDLSFEAWLRDGRDLGMLRRKPATWGLSARYTQEYLWSTTWGGAAHVGVGQFFSAANGNFANGNATRWYLFADPNMRPAVRYGYLTGYESPEIYIKAPDAQRLAGGLADPYDGSFLTDDIEFKLRFFWGSDLMDFRGAYCSELALTIANLDAAIVAFRSLTDPAGNLSPYMGPLTLVVPTSLEATAKNIVNSTIINPGGVSTLDGNANPMQGVAALVVNYWLDLI
jgi:hypothetical protein